MTPHIWKYEDYSPGARSFAKTYTQQELEKMLAKLEGEQAKNTRAHLDAIEKSTSMAGNSQHRAQAGNVVSANWEQRRLLRDAIEIHQIYPEKTRR